MKYTSKSSVALLFACLFSFYGMFLSGAQTAGDQPNYSPRDVVYNHLYYLQPDSYQPELAARSFAGEDLSSKKNAAIQLKQILDGKGLYVDINVLPDENILPDSIGRQRYVLFASEPDIFLEKTGGKWFYSKSTVEAIPLMHHDIYPFGANLMKRFDRPGLQGSFLMIKTWQWIWLGVFLIVAILIHRLLSLCIRWVIPKLSRTKFIYTQTEVDKVASAARTFSFFIVTRLLILLLPILLLHPEVSRYVVRSLHILGISFLIIFFIFVVDLIMIYFNRLAEKTENTMDDQIVPVMRRLLKGLVIVVGLMFILNMLNVNVTALLAGISIGGLALALAAQDTVKNLIGSVVIFIDRPFQIGDWINFDGVDGTVEEVGIRSTRLRTFANSVTSVPNGKLADMTIDNLGARVFRRYKTTVGVTYDTPPDLIDVFVRGIRELIKAHPYSRKDVFEVHLNEFGSSSLNILIYMFFEVPTWQEELVGKHDLMLGIIKLAEHLGIRFAFPTTTLHIEDLPGQKSLTPVYDLQTRDFDQQMKEFVKSYAQRFEQRVEIKDGPL